MRIRRAVRIMGEVAAKIRVMPSGMDVDLNKLKDALTKAIPEGARIHGFSEEPVAFGLKALMVVVKVGDIEGGTEKVEEEFSKVKGVESVSVEELGRM
jgi:elongation factor 1-beta